MYQQPLISPPAPTGSVPVTVSTAWLAQPLTRQQFTALNGGVQAPPYNPAKPTFPLSIPAGLYTIAAVVNGQAQAVQVQMYGEPNLPGAFTWDAYQPPTSTPATWGQPGEPPLPSEDLLQYLSPLAVAQAIAASMGLPPSSVTIDTSVSSLMTPNGETMLPYVINGMTVGGSQGLAVKMYKGGGVFSASTATATGLPLNSPAPGTWAGAAPQMSWTVTPDPGLTASAVAPLSILNPLWGGWELAMSTQLGTTNNIMIAPIAAPAGGGGEGLTQLEHDTLMYCAQALAFILKSPLFAGSGLTPPTA